MTILVAYAPRPEGQAALDKGIEIAMVHKTIENGVAMGITEAD